MILRPHKTQYTTMEQWIIISGFFMISLPLYASNKILDYIKLFNTDINVFHIAYGVIILSMLLRQRNIDRINKIYFAIIGLILIVLFHLFYGVFQGNSATYILRDLNLYILPTMVFIPFYSLFKNKEFELVDLLDYFFYAVLVCSTINIIMYVTSSWSLWGVTTYAGNRFGGSYLSNIIFVFWYGLFRNRYSTKKINNLIIIYFAVITIISIMLSQSRALLMLALLVVLIVSFQNVFVEKGRVSIRNLLISMAIIAMLIGGFLIILNGQSDLAARLSSTDMSSKDDSGILRLNTYISNLNFILKEPLGAGLGTLFPIYNGYKNIIGYSNFIDNAFLTFAEKLGVLGLIFYLYFIIYSPMRYLYRMYRDSNSKIYLFTIIGFIAYLINTTFLTAQTINGIGVSALIWIFSAYTTSKRNVKVLGGRV